MENKKKTASEFFSSLTEVDGNNQTLGQLMDSLETVSASQWINVPEVIKFNNEQVPKFTPEKAVKHDNNKPDLDLIPPEFQDAVALAFMDGERKYSRHNYRNGMEWTRLLSAAKRHLNAFSAGEDYAEDSKVHHLGHAGACIAMLMDFYVNKLGKDNRRPIKKGVPNE